MTNTIEARPPVPPFTRDMAIQKVRMAENAWNNQNSQKIAF